MATPRDDLEGLRRFSVNFLTVDAERCKRCRIRVCQRDEGQAHRNEKGELYELPRGMVPRT